MTETAELSKPLTEEQVNQIIEWHDDPVKFIFSGHVKTLDKEKNEIKPFGQFDAPGDLPGNVYRAEIEALIRDLHAEYIKTADKKSFCIDKSRRMYISETLLAGFTLWVFIFQSNRTIGVTSRGEEFLDSVGITDTLFGLFRFAYKHLPIWLRLKDNEIVDSYNRIVNMVNNNAIIGSVSVDCFRGMALTYCIVDEEAMIEHMHSKFSSINEACNNGFIIHVSTPRGKHTFQAAIRFNKSEKLIYRTYHWSKRKTVEWYAEKVKEYLGQDALRAQELDISYEGSVPGRVFKYFISAEHVRTYNPLELCELLSRCTIRTGFDPGLSHAGVFIWQAKTPTGQYIYFDELCMRESTINLFCEEYNRINREWGINERQIVNYADPATHQRHLSEERAVSQWDIIEAKGIRLTNAENDVATGILVMNSLLAAGRIIVSSKCVGLIDSFNEAVYQTNKNGEVVGTKYKESEFSDILDGARYSLTEEIRYKLFAKREETLSGMAYGIKDVLNRNGGANLPHGAPPLAIGTRPQNVSDIVRLNPKW